MSAHYPYEDPLDLDTIVSLMHVNYAIENWEEVLSFSDQLMVLAKEVHEELVETDSTSHTFKQHIIYYFGYSHLMRGLSYQKLGDFDKAREYISFYANLDWLNDSSETSRYLIEHFKFFASANELQLDILDGNIERLPEYIQFLDNNSDQVLQGLTNIIRSANKFNYNVDAIITQLSKHVKGYTHYKDKVRASHYLSFQYELALYRNNNNDRSTAIDITLHILVVADRLGNDKYFKKAISLFEIIRKFGSVSQLKTCYTILNHIIMRGDLPNEKGHSFNFNSPGNLSINRLS